TRTPPPYPAYIPYTTLFRSAGWSIAMATAGFERGLMLRSPARFQKTARDLIALYRRHQASADRDPAIRDAVLKSWMDAEAYALRSEEHTSELQSRVDLVCRL